MMLICLQEMKETNGGEIRRMGQGQGKGEQQKQNMEMEWPRLDAANSADELLMTNGNAHEHEDAQHQMGKEQKDRHRQQSSPHSDESEYWLVILIFIEEEKESWIDEKVH